MSVVLPELLNPMILMACIRISCGKIFWFPRAGYQGVVRAGTIMTPRRGERFFDFPVIHYNSCQKQKKRFLRDVGTHIAIDKVIPFFFLHHFLPPITARFTRAVLVSETGLDSEDAKP